jgi:serine/threonine protein kinase/WD40 repeat protein
MSVAENAAGKGGGEPRSSPPDPVGEAVARFLESCRRGERPSPGEFAARYPDHAEELERVLSTLLEVEEAAAARKVGSGNARPASPESAVPPRLGEYRILREAGRGGMGVVYEAVQESLGRRVALKVLPFSSTAEPRRLQRFQRESRAAAALHHANIVPVFGVGQDGGVHYYAMQFVDGEPLDCVLAEVRRLRGSAGPAFEEGDRTSAPEGGPGLAALRSDSSVSDVVRPGREGSSAFLLPAGREHLYFHNVARLILQAAEALSHAHAEGILHRDIKPSNLLVEVGGRIWITDFGLAKWEGSEELTLSGEVVGTISYMAPERFRGWCDARSDIYSLGMTLYECLTLRPAFSDTDRGRLMHRIASEEPPLPRKVEPNVPRDLETVTLKAIEKEPGRRYRTARELAQDLEAFLDGRPILARRATALERAWRWCRRNRTLAVTAAAAALFFIAAALGLLTALWLGAERERALQGERLSRRGEREARFWEVLSDARAKRGRGQPGQRFDNLDALRDAAARLGELELPPGGLAEKTLRLRNEAIACMALDDLQVTKRREVPEGTTFAAFDATLDHYARGDRQGNISVRRVEDDAEVAHIAGAGVPIAHLQFGPGNLLLAATLGESGEPGFCLWDLSRKASLLEVAGVETYPPFRCAQAADFSPDGARLAIGRPGGKILLYDLPAARLWKELPPLGYAEVGILRFSPDGRRLAIAAGPTFKDCTAVYVRELEGGAVTARLDQSAAAVGGLAWHPGGDLIAVGGWAVRVYQSSTGRMLPGSAPTDTPTLALAFHPEGGRFAATTWNRTVYFMDPFTGMERFQTNAGTFLNAAPRFSPDGERLGTAGPELRLWRTPVARECRSLQGVHSDNTTGVSVGPSPCGRLLALASYRGVEIWEAPGGREVASLNIGLTFSAIFHPSGRFLITSGLAGLHRWPLEPPAAPAGPLPGRIGPPEAVPLSVTKHLAAAALSRDGNVLAVMHHGHVHVLRLDSGEESQLAGVHWGQSWIDISPDGSWIATSPGNADGEHVKVWDATSGACVRELPPPQPAFAAFSPDGRALVVGERQAQRFWEVGSWRSDRSLPWQSEVHTQFFAFSYDGVFARLRAGGLLQLMDTGTFAELATLEPPRPRLVNSICFSPNGDWLAAATREEGGMLWDLAAIRKTLRGIGLDWEPPLPGRPTVAPGGALEVISGDVCPPGKAETPAERAECERRLELRVRSLDAATR